MAITGVSLSATGAAPVGFRHTFVASVLSGKTSVRPLVVVTARPSMVLSAPCGPGRTSSRASPRVAHDDQ